MPVSEITSFELRSDGILIAEAINPQIARTPDLIEIDPALMSTLVGTGPDRRCGSRIRLRPRPPEHRRGS